MADVFISYAREDRSLAEQVARALSGLGLDTFWDTDIPPGQTWADYIEGKLTACRAVVVLWSQHSTKSQWVREEARLGRDKSKLIPVMIDGTPAPFGFGEVQAADLSAWNGDVNHPEWARFAGAVQRAAGAPAQPQAPQPRVGAPQPAWTATPNVAAAAVAPWAYVLKCLRLYVDGKGRARRSEYIWWLAFVVAVTVVLMGIETAVFGYNEFTGAAYDQTLSSLGTLALVAPGVSVTARRLHDINLSGWYAAAIFGALLLGSALVLSGNAIGSWVALGAFIAALFLGVRPGAPGANQHGPDPKI